MEEVLAEGELNQHFSPIFNQFVFDIDGKAIEFIISESDWGVGDHIKIILQRERWDDDPCGLCDGKGFIDKNVCQVCGGSGKDGL